MVPQARFLLLPLVVAAFLSGGCLLGGDDDSGPSGAGDGDDVTPMITATAEPQEYVVQAGDTLSGIAAQFDVPLALLQQVNGIANANQLQVGQTLTIPQDGQAAPTETAPDTDTATLTATATVTATPANSSSSCDRSYPDVCIPSSPPLLTCEDITQRGFRVVAPDPHNFDVDNDGFGCEDGDL